MPCAKRSSTWGFRRIGIEAGELVVEDAESTFATGEAVNLAARLQQAAMPGEILVGPTAYRLAAGSLVVEDVGPKDLKGLDGPLRAWRVVDMLDGPGRSLGPRAPLVGRESELELLENTFNRSVRDRRAHLFTIYGEPGVGKSRVAREFLDGVERASVLMGRALPYGEGVTYWPLAEMVKAAAGISDDDPLEEAFEKLRECCAEEAVADVLGLAAGLMEALEGERSSQEIAWAASEVMHGIADVQPLILLFEDIHWAEAPLLDLIEHLADFVRAPLLIVCLARPELLEARPGWGGGRVRSTAIELGPLSEEESELLVEKLLAQLAGTSGAVPAPLPREVLERTEGNPLFVEETIRMIIEAGSGSDAADRVPDSLQALIAARIDHLPPAAKTLLQRASVVGRVFWSGALEHLSPDVEGSARCSTTSCSASSCFVSRARRSPARRPTGSSTSSSARSPTRACRSSLGPSITRASPSGWQSERARSSSRSARTTSTRQSSSWSSSKARRPRSSRSRPAMRSSKPPSARSHARRTRRPGSSRFGRSSSVRRFPPVTWRLGPPGGFRTGLPSRSRWRRFATRHRAGRARHERARADGAR